MTTLVAVDAAPLGAEERARGMAVCHALADETRLAILELLRGGERCVCDLQDALHAAQSRLSFHLRVLKEAGLVADRRAGRWSYYRTVPEAFAMVERMLASLHPTNSETERSHDYCC